MVESPLQPRSYPVSMIQERMSVVVDAILLATDFTPASEKAAAYAKAIAKRFSSTVEIAHVFDPSKVISYEEGILSLPLPERLKNSADYLEILEAEFRDEGFRAHAISLEGHFVGSALLKIAHEKQVDLIVTGTESKHGSIRHMLGSTAEELIRRAKYPVLTVGPKAMVPKAGPLVFRSIVFATDFNAESAKAAMFAISFAEDSGAHLYLCHVVAAHPGDQPDSPTIDIRFQAALATMIPKNSYDWYSPECVLEHGEAAHGILALAERVHADLIVVGPRKATFWLDHVEHGTTPDVLAEATCPVLTVC